MQQRSAQSSHLLAPMSLAEFQRACNASFVPLEITSPDPASFVGRLGHAEAYGVSFTDIRSTAQHVRRTPELIAASPTPYFKISLQMEGHGIHRQHGREVDLQPGDLAVYDTTQPYELEFTGPFRVLVMMLPHSRLQIPAHLVDRVTAVRLDGSIGLGRVVSPFLATLGANLDELRGPAGVQLVQNAVQLLDTLLANEFELAKIAADPRRATLERIRDEIDQRLGDPDLTPSSVAEHAYISLRHLHALFHEQGETVAAYIRTRRLERIYIDLADPTRLHLSVAAIGARWGFGNAAHFSRTFKAVYGESPSEVRRRTLG